MYNAKLFYKWFLPSATCGTCVQYSELRYRLFEEQRLSGPLVSPLRQGYQVIKTGNGLKLLGLSLLSEIEAVQMTFSSVQPFPGYFLVSVN